MTNFIQHNGRPPAHTHTHDARPTLVRVWYSLNANGAAPLVSTWIAIPHAPNTHSLDSPAPDVCAFHLCSLELRAPSESATAACQFDGPALTLRLTVTRA